MQKPTELLETYEPKTYKRKYSAANKKTSGIMKTNTEKSDIKWTPQPFKTQNKIEHRQDTAN